MHNRLSWCSFIFAAAAIGWRIHWPKETISNENGTHCIPHPTANEQYYHWQWGRWRTATGQNFNGIDELMETIAMNSTVCANNNKWKQTEQKKLIETATKWMVSKRRKNVLSHSRLLCLFMTDSSHIAAADPMPSVVLTLGVSQAPSARCCCCFFSVHFIFISFYISVSAWHSSESQPHDVQHSLQFIVGKKSFPECDKMGKYEPMMSSITGATTWNGLRHFGQLKTTWVTTNRWYETIINDFKTFSLMLLHRHPHSHTHSADGAFLFAGMSIEHKTWKIAFANRNDDIDVFVFCAKSFVDNYKMS